MGPDSRPLILGLGNDERGDDGCGRSAARLLRDRLGARAEVLDGSWDGSRLLDLWEGRSTVVVVDAVRSGAPLGSVLRFEVTERTVLPRPPLTSSHGLSLPDAIELGRSLDRLPRRLIVYGIEAASMAPGNALSPAVRQGVDEVVVRIAREIDAPEGPDPVRPELTGHA